MTTNPFLQRSTLEYELPPFAQITEDDYLEAFYAGTAEQVGEIDSILAQSEVTFENTIVALEKSGQTLGRMLNVFYNKSSSDTNDHIDSIEAEIAPKLAAHSDAIRLNPALFGRIQKLVDAKLDLPAEDAWLLQRYYKDFLQAGAALDEEARNRVKAINEELSSLETQFSKNLLADTNDLAVFVDSVEELEGLSENQIAACKAAAEARGVSNKWMISMVNFTGHPVLSSLKNRALRQRIMERSLSKGARGNASDTRQVLLRMVELRALRAKLFGLSSHAEYVLREQTAGHPDRVHAMLRKIAPAAVENAEREARDIQAIIDKTDRHELRSWDWDLFTEQVRAEKYDLDTAAMKPYFELEKVLIDGVFFAAQKLYGMTFKARPDLVTYHPEARAFEVFNEDGSAIGLYIGDFYTRDSKRGGAWMNTLVDQNHLLGQYPVVVNNMNIPKPPAGQPTLLTTMKRPLYSTNLAMRYMDCFQMLSIHDSRAPASREILLSSHLRLMRCGYSGLKYSITMRVIMKQGSAFRRAGLINCMSLQPSMRDMRPRATLLPPFWILHGIHSLLQMEFPVLKISKAPRSKTMVLISPQCQHAIAQHIFHIFSPAAIPRGITDISGAKS
jgi:peptidyl-dipeptidase Dcp